MVLLTRTHRRRLTTRRVTPDQRELRGALLHSHAQGAVVRGPQSGDGPIDYIEGRLPFKQLHLVVERNVSRLAVVVIGRAPLNVEDAVGRRATDRGEDSQVGAGVAATEGGA